MVTREAADSTRRGVARQAAKKLIQRVDLDELDAGDLVDLLAAHALEYRLHHAVGARVAVVIGILQQVAALAQERVVDAPAVHSDALEPGVRHDFKTTLHLEPQPENVPPQRAVRPDGFVLKSAHLVEGQDAGPERADDGAPALGSEIECEECRQILALYKTLSHCRVRADFSSASVT